MEPTPTYPAVNVNPPAAVPISQAYPVTQYPKHLPAQSPAPVSAASAGLLGLIVGATGAMGSNLHKVNQGEMTMGRATTNSLVTGAKAGLATFAATTASRALTDGGAVGLAVTLATATGVMYLLNT